MCKPASFVLTKDKVYWNRNNDSHEDIITEHNLDEKSLKGIEILRVEISPGNYAYNLPANQWIFKIDQDIMPHWFISKDDIEFRTRKELPAWIKCNIGNNVGLYNSGRGNSGEWNSGDWNSGHGNSGDQNSGHGNSGDQNSGQRNSGDYNSGHGNSGYGNSGRGNSGHYNSGKYNSGQRNSGNYNSGDWNSGHGNSGDWNSGNNCGGVFCTEEEKIKIFDEQSPLTFKQWREHPARRVLLSRNKKTWDKFTEKEWETIKTIPNFNAKKFEKITGIKV